jgi:hypothetical protein
MEAMRLRRGDHPRLQLLQQFALGLIGRDSESIIDIFHVALYRPAISQALDQTVWFLHPTDSIAANANGATISRIAGVTAVKSLPSRCRLRTRAF